MWAGRRRLWGQRLVVTLHLVHQGSLSVFSPREYSENGENFIEVPLNFDPVIREDLNTEFRCTVSNSQGFETLQTTVKEGMYPTNGWKHTAQAVLTVAFALFW